MLDYFILQNKSIIGLKDRLNNNVKTECLDLLSNNYDTTFGGCKVYIVEKWYVARPDLISLAVYKTDKYADIICKINGISNPFELNEGMVIALPNEENMIEAMRVRKNSPSEIIEEDDNIVKKDLVTTTKKTDSRSGNELLVGESNYYIDRTNNVIFY